jgi:hypothetical protein
MSKIKLTERQCNILANHIVESMVNEGGLDSIKYGIAQLGRLFKSSKAKEYNTQTIEDLINKEGNKLLSDLNNKVNGIAPGFPNNKNNVDFLRAVMAITTVYDTIVEATKLNPNEDGYIQPRVANDLIWDLQSYVEEHMNNLSTMYSVVNEGENDDNVRNYFKGKEGNDKSSKGLKSRYTTLNDLYNSFKWVDASNGDVEAQYGTPPSADTNVEPNAAPEPNSNTAPVPNSNAVPEPVNYDNLYNSLSNLFRFIGQNKNILDTSSGKNVGTGTAINNSRMKPNDIYLYNGNKVKILNTNLNGRVQVQSTNKAKNIFTVTPDKLERVQPIAEGRFIKDKRLIGFLSKNLPNNKLSLFEKFMFNVETARNIIKKVKPSNDKVLNNFITNFQKNPIMATDFQKLLNISVENPKEVNSLKYFIDDLFITLYSGKYKFNSLVDKITGISESNKNEKRFLADAQDRGAFKTNLIKFLTDAVNLYQYLSKQKNNSNKK